MKQWQKDIINMDISVSGFFKQIKTSKMHELTETLTVKRTTSYGHFKISIDRDGETLSTITTNTTCIDEFDQDSKEVLVNEILKANK